MSQLLLHLNLNIVMLLNFLLKVCLELLWANCVCYNQNKRKIKILRQNDVVY